MKEYLEERINEECMGGDFQIPSAEETFKKLDPHVMRLLESQNESRGYRAARLRPVIPCVAIIMIVGVVAIKPVRAEIVGVITELYNTFRNDVNPMYTLKAPGAELISNEMGDGYTVSFYKVDGYSFTIIQEYSQKSGWAWVDRAGEPYTVNGLKIGSTEAMCYEDADGQYAVIELSENTILVSMDKRDRDLFAEILRSIEQVYD